MQVYRAIKYIRLSYTDDKSTESDSVANQRKLIDNYIVQHPEIEVVDEKIDDGYSGVLFDRASISGNDGTYQGRQSQLCHCQGPVPAGT